MFFSMCPCDSALWREALAWILVPSRHTVSAPSRKCMNSADLAMPRFRRSFFLPSIVSDGLLRFGSRHFNDLDDIR